MKLLGWMHRKLTHNSMEPMKDFTTGKASTCFSMHTLFDKNKYLGEPTNTLSHSNIRCQKPTTISEANNEEVIFNAELLQPFDFLSIGTFGLELLNTDPPTPSLPTPFGPFTNEQDEQEDITENDLELMNFELEKFIEAEEKEMPNYTSGRTSHVSVTTLMNKPVEEEDSEGQLYVVACPLQNYLFATSVELAATDKEVKREKASLGELFKRSTIVDDPMMKSKGAEQKTRRRNLAHFMKKAVKKIHATSSSSKVSTKNDATISNPIKKKLSKALKMFCKKVHPEDTTEEPFIKQQDGMKKNIFYQMKEGERKGNTIKISSDGICKSPSTASEHWIKTDSDYLVLEL